MSSLKAGARRILAGLTLAVSAIALPPAQAAGLRIGSVESIAPTEISRPRAASDAAVPGRREIRFDAFGRRFELAVNTNQGFVAGPGRADSVEGTAAGLSGSWVRLTRVGDSWVGVVFDGTEYFALDTAGAVAPFNDTARRMPRNAPIAYRLRDTLLPDTSFGTDVVPHVGTVEDALNGIQAELTPPTATAVLATKRLTVGVLIDADEAARDGSEAEARATARMGIVDGIFSSQVGVRIQPTPPVLLAPGSAPSTTDDAETLLDQLGVYRRDDQTQRTTGLTHLFTGRNIIYKGSANTVGIAYLTGLCQRRSSASLSEGRQTAFTEGLIAAHEIGHVFGAPHDTESGSACAAAPSGFLMEPRLNGHDTLSDCSLSQMAPLVATASCLAPANAPDAAIGAASTAAIAVGQFSNIRASVRSNGNATVTNVHFVIRLPAGVEAKAAGATGATCPLVTPSEVQCVLGDLAAGATSDIQITVIAASAGNTQAELEIFADNDALAGNNRTTLQLIAAPGADFGVSITFDPASLQQGMNTLARVQVRNDGLSDATDLALTVTSDAGLTAQTAAVSGGLSCAVAAGNVSCAPATLAAGATAELQLTLQAGATATGIQRVRAQVGSATLVDPAPGNNDVTGAVTVTPASSGGGDDGPLDGTLPAPVTPPASSGGGGGALDGTLLLALTGSLTATLRRRRLATR